MYSAIVPKIISNKKLKDQDRRIPMLCDTEAFRESFPLIIYIKHLIRGLTVTLLKIKPLVFNIFS